MVNHYISNTPRCEHWGNGNVKIWGYGLSRRGRISLIFPAEQRAPWPIGVKMRDFYAIKQKVTCDISRSCLLVSFLPADADRSRDEGFL